MGGTADRLKWKVENLEYRVEEVDKLTWLVVEVDKGRLEEGLDRGYNDMVNFRHHRCYHLD
jgi:hypothetical protein